nr:hypothetical protein CFP56_63520 [Quercus suber]
MVQLRSQLRLVGTDRHERSIAKSIAAYFTHTTDLAALRWCFGWNAEEPSTTDPISSSCRIRYLKPFKMTETSVHYLSRQIDVDG